MTTRVRSALARGTASQAAAELAAQLQSAGEAPALLLAFGSMQQPLDILLPELAARFPGSAVLGASTAGEFTERGDTKDAACALAVSGDYRVYAGIGVGLAADPERALGSAIEGQPMQVHGYPHRAALLFLDPLAGNGEETTLLASALLGDNVLLAGGAAGDYLAMKQTLVGCGPRVASDAVVIAQIFSKQPLGIGICHGHRTISDPLRVTSSQGNTVLTIDERPAWEVWRKHTARAAAQRGLEVDKLAAEDIPAFLLQYEAGLSVGGEIKIRAPLSLGENGAIHFACGVPKGTVFRVTESEPERQIASAREAARRARERLGGARPAGAVVFDCICRNLILGERFGTAVRAISEELGQVPIAGFETYGEIALDVGDMSGFHNTTSVVLAFPEE
jgi:methyl-accepting chemotaxis protein